MYISKIDINNYRLLKKTSINCEKELSLIIGKNNCGKTSLLSILSKCIGSKTEVDKFEFYDFSISFQKKLYEVVQGISSFSEDELAGIRLDLYIEYDETDDLTNISKLMLDLDPQNTTVVLRFEHVLKNKLQKLKDEFVKYKAERDTLPSETAFEKFIVKNHKKYFEFNRYSVLYDYKTKSLDNKTFRFLDNKDVDVSKIIAFKYISAKRSVSNATDLELSTLAGNYYNTSKNQEQNATTTLKFEKQVDDADKAFNDIYLETFKDLMGKISRFGGIKKDENVMKIISQIQVQKLLKDNTTVVYEDQLNFLPEHYNGLGYLNLFSIIMKIETLMSELRKDNKKDENPADINILFLEEPEAHTHPQMQYVFVKNIKELLETGRKIEDTDKTINLQTFMTTHSSHIVAESDFDDIKYFLKDKTDDGANVTSKDLKDLEIIYQKEKGKDNNHFKFLKQYLTLNRSEVFFADKIILIEGDTERILLPAMIAKIDQKNKYDIPLLSQNISIIEVGNYSEIYAEFIKFIGTKTLIITDIDTYYLTDAMGDDGNVKLNKDGTPKQTITSCRVSKGTHTSNNALKFYLKEQIQSKENTQIEQLAKLTIDRKTIVANEIKNEEENQTTTVWNSNKDGKLLVVYQVEESNCDGTNYIARSFEDAFFHINKNFFTDLGGANDEENIKRCAESFQSLKHIKLFFDKTMDSFDLSIECVNKKPSLAMDILLNSKSNDIEDFINWETPKYIREGLEWLQRD